MAQLRISKTAKTGSGVNGAFLTWLLGATRRGTTWVAARMGRRSSALSDGGGRGAVRVPSRGTTTLFSLA